ncbi:MAG TPA: alpha-(1-_3)-arabinofuranosyltransferase family protein [Phycicoccus sp.]|nr:alpha-(1->3)-arabinofuranosyltransferase family protein [Phycicoccus sp.]
MSGAPSGAAPRERIRILAGVLLVAAVAWSVPGGLVSADTKNDLYVDAWGFLGRSLHLWDTQVTWGVLQNQGYGYLFPMGPYFGVATEVLPAWVAQRLWWTILLVGGFLAVHALLRALAVGTPATRLAAAVVYALSPRVLTTLGGLSSEALPALLAPAILLPAVLAARGRLPARRAAAWSGLALLACGGVNATATFFAAVPTILFLLTRRGWWRRPLTWWWCAGAGLAVAWWLGPLVVLGRYSPPFLDWIESSADVVRNIDAVDALRGTTHWLQLLVTGAGPWWPAGHALATVPLLVLATTLVGAIGLAGLGLPAVPERRWLLITLAAGVTVILIAHPGPVSSPLSESARALLDGPLAPFRNVHKADPLVRLPLAVGLAHSLAALARATRRRRLAVPAAVAVVSVIAAVVSPGLTGAVAPPGAYRAIPAQWVDAGAWLSARAGDGRALVVPAATFGEYDWGRPIDEPIRPLSTVDHGVRDGVPLTPAGTIRFLDDVEHRLQEGHPLGGEAAVLRRAGVRWLVLRNDLDARVSGQPPVALARSAIRSTAGVTLAKGFGPTRLDASGERVFPVEVYDLGAPAPLAVTEDLGAVTAVAGGPEDLADVLESGESGLVVLDGDRPEGVALGRRVVTDGYRERNRWFGATRGRDASSTLTAAEALATDDYRPWSDPSLASSVSWEGVASVSASSSLATRYTIAGLRPADRPAAALDDDPATAWTTLGDPRPTLDVRLVTGRTVRSAYLVALRPEEPTVTVGRPRTVRVTTDAGPVTVRLPDSGIRDVVLPPGPTSSVQVEILDTDRGDPADVLTGLTTVRLAGVEPLETVSLPGSAAASEHGRADRVVLDAGLPGSTGCVRPAGDVVCLGAADVAAEGGRVLARVLPDVGAGAFAAAGVLEPSLGGSTAGLAADGVRVTASSARSHAAPGRPEGVVDGDPATAWSPAVGDRSPRLTVALDAPVDVEGLLLTARHAWMARNRPFVEVSLDGVTTVVRASADGHVAVRGRGVRRISLRLLLVDRTAAAAALELEEVQVLGADLPRPPRTVELPCGEGPRLVVDGRQLRTSASGPRSALWGDGALRWRACGPVTLGAGGHELRLDAVSGWRPRTVVLTRADSSPSNVPGPTPVAATWDGPAHVTGTMGEGAERLLALTVNTNRGWVASLGGRPLAPVVVDGFRQGFIVPAGVGGHLDVTFAPDRAYRFGLLGGAVLALLLPLGLVLPGGGPVGAVPAARRPRARPAVLVPVVVSGAALLGGPAGAAAAAAGVGLALLVGRRGTTAWVGGGLAAVAGALQAGALLASTRGSWVEAVSTLVLIAGASVVATGLVVPPTASPGARRGAGSPTPGRGRWGARVRGAGRRPRGKPGSR